MIRQLPTRNRLSRETYRKIGALLGLAIGIGLMLLLGFGGLVAGAIFGAGGCVAGAISAEQLHDRTSRDD